MKNKNIKPHHSNPLEELSDEELSQMLDRGSYSVNLRWEAIRRKLTKGGGGYEPEKSGSDSLFMLNRLAFFSELNNKVEAILKSDLKHLGESSGVDRGKTAVKFDDETDHRQIDEYHDELADTAYTKTDNRTGAELNTFEEDAIQNKKRKSETLEKGLAKIIHENFSPTSFLSWIRQFDGNSRLHGSEVNEVHETIFNLESETKIVRDFTQSSPANKKNKKGKKGKKKKDKVIKNNPDLVLDPGIASETLANLLAIQGYIDDANEMYRQLGIKYPEKSSYFASKIKKS